MKKVSKNVKIVVSVIALVCVAGIAIGTVAIINKNKKNEPKENPVIINEATEAPTAVPTAVPSVITPVPTDVPEVTEAPEATETSEVTEAPDAESTLEPEAAPTEVPAQVTEAPKATEKAETPKPTAAQKATEAPKATEKPAEYEQPVELNRDSNGNIIYDEVYWKWYSAELAKHPVTLEDLGGIGGEFTAEELEAEFGHRLGRGDSF